MKKRILSAVLALAMALTLLPMSVFAAYQTPGTADPSTVSYTTGTGGNQQTHQFYEVNISTGAVSTVQVSRCTTPGDGTGRAFGKWYWLDNKNDPQNPKYYEVTTGIIAGNNGSGNWYPDQAAFVTTSTGTFEGTAGRTINKLRSTTLTLLGTTSLDMSSGNWSDTSLQVDIAGSGTLTLAQNATNVTVTSKFVTGTPTGTVAAITRDHSGYSTVGSSSAALTLNATNVDVGAIDLDGRANTVTLTNCKAAGIDMNGATDTTNNNTVDKTTFSAQRLTVNNCQVGAIAISGDGSSVQLTSANGGTPSTAGGTVSIEGKGGTLTIAGASNVGAVTAKSRATGTTDTANSTIPTVTVSGGTVASISTTGDLGPGSASITLNTQSGKTNVGDVEVKKGSVSAAANVTTGNITVPDGSVTLAGPLTTGTVTLGATAATALSITGNGSDIAGITATDNNLTIRSWPTGRNNDFGTVSLGSYAGKGIAGGTFDGAQAFNDANKLKWVNTTSLLYQVNVDTAKTALYNKDELGKAIEDIGKDKAAAPAGNIGIIGQALTNKITLKYGSETLAVIGHDAITPIILPSRINGKNIVSWMQVSAGSVVNSYVSGREYTVPATALELNATNVSEDVAKITGVAAKVAGLDTNIRAELKGTTINLSGAVDGGVGNVTGITLDLTTDVVGTDGQPVKLIGVPVDFNNTTKAIQFNSFWVPTNGARIENGQLVLANGTRYTVTGSGLAVPSGKVNVEDSGTYEIKATLGGRLGSWRPEAKDELIELLTGGDAAFTTTGNTAMAEAINAALSTVVTDSTVENWVKTAQTTIWRSGFKSPDSTKNTDNGYVNGMTPHSGTLSSTDPDGAAIVGDFKQAWLVPYLQVNATDYDESGLLTATLQPMYRIDVSGDAYDPDMAYTVQAGRALSALTGDMLTNPVKVKLNLGAAFATQKMHQDGKYVYTGVGGEWTINHAGATGLGTIQINGLDGMIELTSAQTGAKPASGKYDSLQAAVDDTVPEVGTDLSKIKINGGYTGSCAFTMTGAARTIEIEALGNKDVSCGSGYVTKTQIDGETYTFQLSRDTVVVGGNVEIVVNSANYGSVTSDLNKASVGQTVTLTVKPSNGYKVNTLTAVTDGNVKVPITATGTVNEYTFVVPTDAKKVTITPTFVVADNKASINVNGNSAGTASVYTGTTDGRAEQGSTVIVTVQPKNGYRTMDVTLRADNGSVVYSSRQSKDTWNVTIPSGATLVTVTPSFDVDNGTPFVDVKSNSWSSQYISWMYRENFTTGKDTQYTFKPTDNVTRQELVSFLWKANGSVSMKNSSYKNPFTDVYTSDWAYDAILWAAANGLIDTSSRTFGKTVNASRAEVVTILYKYAGSPAATTKTGFIDVPTSASYAKAVSWAEKEGITNGKDNRNTFKPNIAITRQEVAKMLYVAEN